MVDSDNVEIRYSLRQMTKLWRHIFVAKVWASLQHARSWAQDIIFESIGYLMGIDAVVSCIMWQDLRQFNIY